MVTARVMKSVPARRIFKKAIASTNIPMWNTRIKNDTQAERQGGWMEEAAGFAPFEYIFAANTD